MPSDARPRQIGVISFFSGIGSLDLGFEKGGFRTWMANEHYEPFSVAYRHVRQAMGEPQPERGMQFGPFDSFSEGWRRLALLAAMGEAREATGLVGFIGGPPCPDFSVAGSQQGHGGINGRLTQRYADMICALQPDFFVLENVKGLWSTARNMDFYRRIRRQLSDWGYHIADRLLNSIRYGVPQDRSRVIVIGFRNAAFRNADLTRMAADFPWDCRGSQTDPKTLPWPGKDVFVENSERLPPPGLPDELTVEWWFRRNGVETHPNAGHGFLPKQSTLRFRSVEEGDTSRKSFKRLHRWRYSPTAAYGNNEVHLHPYKPRRLSVAEAMAIQSFPSSLELPPDMSLSDMFKTVGNAVPFLFAEALAKNLRDTLDTASRR